MPNDTAAVVPALLLASPLVSAVKLAGSRATGTAGPYSDWDFEVSTEDFGVLAGELPGLLRALDPLVEQWDRLTDHACYLLVVSGPTKIDLIFDDVPHEHEPPWVVDAETLRGIDGHFWDWVLWLKSKADAGKAELVSAELVKMHHHLLAPLGVPAPPTSLAESVEQYLGVRDRWAHRVGVSIDRRLEHEVIPVVQAVSRRTRQVPVPTGDASEEQPSPRVEDERQGRCSQLGGGQPRGLDDRRRVRKSSGLEVELLQSSPHE